MGVMLVCLMELRTSEPFLLLLYKADIALSDYNAEQGIYWVTVKSPVAEVMGKVSSSS